ncbi:DUF805 domain-containing protein [Aliiroseovarius sp. F20344]|uniref:DUF805 domain-containing protein n=1 Tax=Aliiroseovarius sp. F20344 TaxID=2926414 RepID=UPI001FF38B5F|nr:DUF805 domain-containing protein [Aliiroseovarius sp. F20344]MCK0142734.1 DUF805 domain-containing protein [Aliiroseovarius sp. F20344]
MTPAKAIKMGFSKCFSFSGSASRTEFWWFAAVLAFPFVLSVLGVFSGLNSSFYFLKSFTESFWMFSPIPMLFGVSCAIRRNKDAGVTVVLTIITALAFFGGYWGIFAFSAIEQFSHQRMSIGWIFIFPWLGTSLVLAIPTIVLWALPTSKNNEPLGPNPHEVLS